MYISLLVIGLLLTAGGFVTVGFGIPINAFSLGNTLIVAGTVSVTGGLILIGLAAAVRQLRRIAEALRAGQMVAGRPARPTDMATETDVAPSMRTNLQAQPVLPPAPRDGGPLAPMPRPPMPARGREPGMPRPPEPRGPEPRLNEPRFGEPRLDPHAPTDPRFQAAAPPSSPPGRAPLDWLRPKGGAVPPTTEPPVVELEDEAPLSPRTPARLSPLATLAEPLQEPKAWAPRADDGLVASSAVQDPKLFVRTEPRLDGRPNPMRSGPPMRTAPNVDPVGPSPTQDRDRIFDTMWSSSRSERSSTTANVSPEARVDDRTGVKVDSEAAFIGPKRGTSGDVTNKPAPAEDPHDTAVGETSDADADKPVIAEAADTVAISGPALPSSTPAAKVDLPITPDRSSPLHARLDSSLPASQRPVAVLKSGVIDGMAYTLFADGSIEADLAQGKVRFASVDELRAHLEKHA